MKFQLVKLKHELSRLKDMKDLNKVNKEILEKKSSSFVIKTQGKNRNSKEGVSLNTQKQPQESTISVATVDIAMNKKLVTIKEVDSSPASPRLATLKSLRIDTGKKTQASRFAHRLDTSSQHESSNASSNSNSPANLRSPLYASNHSSSPLPRSAGVGLSPIKQSAFKDERKKFFDVLPTLHQQNNSVQVPSSTLR